MNRLPTTSAFELAPLPEEQRWLLEHLWSAQAVGIIGGEPKSCKSFLALDMAVSIASGTPCLGRFPTRQTGRVLFFPAEDALHVVRDRLDRICNGRGLSLSTLDIQVITTPSLRLDLDRDRVLLEETVKTLAPRALLLDPFVRIHRVDENSCAEIAPILAYLRDLQRRYQLAVIVVHHAKKGGAHARQGQALRGTSEFHGWTDCALYLHRAQEKLLLTIEHRAAPGQASLPLSLSSSENTITLSIPDVPLASFPSSSPGQTIEHALAGAATPLSLRQLRDLCRLRTQTVTDTLSALVQSGRVLKSENGFRLSS
jgi:hypothetical protein